MDRDFVAAGWTEHDFACLCYPLSLFSEADRTVMVHEGEIAVALARIKRGFVEGVSDSNPEIRFEAPDCRRDTRSFSLTRRLKRSRDRHDRPEAFMNKR